MESVILEQLPFSFIVEAMIVSMATVVKDIVSSLQVSQLITTIMATTKELILNKKVFEQVKLTIMLIVITLNAQITDLLMVMHVIS